MKLRKSTTTLGESRGSPRVYLVGKWLEAYGFKPDAKFQILYGSGVVTLVLNAHGDTSDGERCRKVSATPKREPVVQVQSQRLWESFGAGTRKLSVTTSAGKIELATA